jgi:hypothetical protein
MVSVQVHPAAANLEKSTVWDPDVGPKTGKNHDFLLVQQKPLQISGRLRIQVDT